MTTDQSRPVSRVSAVGALTQIRALCDRWRRHQMSAEDFTEQAVAVLDAVSVDATPPQDIDRVNLNPLANRLAAHDFDADDTEVICQDVAEWLGLDDEGYPGSGDRILALVRPVEGIVLSREEARRAVGWLDMSNVVPEGDDLALASRLEVS